jgi:hypothetical protein
MRQLLLALLAFVSPLEAQWSVSAVRYATIKNFPVAALVAGADTTRRLDIAMMVWVLRGSGRTVLVDAGFHHEKFVTQWKPADFVTPAEAVAEAGVKPESVTDIIISHVTGTTPTASTCFRTRGSGSRRRSTSTTSGPTASRSMRRR